MGLPADVAPEGGRGAAAVDYHEALALDGPETMNLVINSIPELLSQTYTQS